MFNRQSRYHRIPDQVTLDENGRARRSKGLRLVPSVSGNFIHTIESDDRLDQLAYKYYRKSKTWWHICDANPDFLSPLDLLGDGVKQRGKLTVRWDDYLPPWNLLSDEMRTIIGVSQVILGETNEDNIETEIIQSSVIGTSSAAFATELNNAVSSQQLPANLDTELQGLGVVLNDNLRFRILVEATVWEIEDIEAEVVYQYRLTSGPPAELTLFETVITHHWTAIVDFNVNRVTLEEIILRIEALGFMVTDSELIGRVGKKILIPPKFTG